jgi:cysteine synthase A
MPALATAARTLPRLSPSADRAWTAAAIRTLEAEAASTPDTPMLELRLPAFPGIRFLLKDESAHPTGSLKHRLARSLFLYALCSGRLRAGQAAIDASSGSTAISEAWFARMLGVPFTAVMPRGTSLAKQREVLALGGRCELLDEGEDTARHAARMAEATGSCFLDQFGLAGAATDWRGNNNIAESITRQCRQLMLADPSWVVCGAGTGGTSATIGRYLRYSGSAARLCVAEPSGSAFAHGWNSRRRDARATRASCIEGIGRARVEPGFEFELAELVSEIADEASIAGALALEHLTGRRFGGSTGTNFVAALRLAESMRAAGEDGCIVLLLCDRGERYAQTIFAAGWLAERGLDPGAEMACLQQHCAGGVLLPPPRA